MTRPGCCRGCGSRPGRGARPPSLRATAARWPILRRACSATSSTSTNGGWLIVANAPLADGTSGVRVDAQTMWITPRPAAERIPRRATGLAVELRRGPRVLAGPFTFVARRRVARVRSLINSIPAAQPGAQSCPNDAGYDVRLTFSSALGEPLAVVDADPQGCQGVQLALGERRWPSLTSEGFPGSGRSPRRPLIGQIDAALGLRLRAKIGVWARPSATSP